MNLMSVDYIDRLEEQLPDVLANDAVRAMIFTGEGVANFSAGMNFGKFQTALNALAVLKRFSASDIEC